MEKPNEPGSAKHGNFINYYSFNPPERRLELIPKTLLIDSCTLLANKTDVLALDIGCNSGDLTLALYEHLTTNEENPSLIPTTSPCHPHHLNFLDVDSDPSLTLATSPCLPSHHLNILGIDSDPLLINRCTQNNRHPDTVSFEHADITSQSDRRETIEGYLNKRNLTRFDVTFVFSVTMWVHLNHGDDGLKDFLRYVSSITTYLVIEPQPWKCYTSAVRRMKKLTCEPFEHYASLKWRVNVEREIGDYLEKSCGMKLVETFGRTQWDRSVGLFVKK